MSAATPLDVFGCALSGTTLVEASAGTGKTWNICALYLRLLLERGLPVQRILVVTFTNAATAELRERVRARIVETLAALRGDASGSDPFVAELLRAARGTGIDDDEIARRLALARAGFDEAAIFTIHGFCQRALADAPFAARMPLALELLEDDAQLRREVVHDFWRRRVGGSAAGAAIAACLNPNRDSPESFALLLRRRLAKPLSRLVWPDEVERLSPADLDLDALRAAHAAARAQWLARREAIVAAVRSAGDVLNRNSYTETSLQAAAIEWERLTFSDDAVSALPQKPGKLDLLGARKLEKCTKKGFATPQDPFFDIAQALLDAREAASKAVASNRLALIRSLLEEGSDEVRRRKRERRVVAFDDMLFNLHERLQGDAGDALAATLRERFPAALIDEFQDTDPLQFAIFRRIYIGHGLPLFFVGDPKQAIYSFRNADLHTYLGARAHVDTAYTLAQNQRSSAALVGAVNDLFAANRQAFMLPGLDFHPAGVGARPRARFVDEGAQRAAMHVWTLPVADGKGLKKDAAFEASSRACAAEIARLLRDAAAGRVTLEGRALAAGDIAVLVRTHRQGNLVREALRALRIASVELSQASVFHTSDADELERILLAVLEPTRERVLRGALVTEILGHDAAALEAMAADAAAGVDAMLRFAGYRDEWLRRGLAPMLRRLVRDEGVAQRLLARPDGERRMTNLLHLAERLQDASREHRSPRALLRWLNAERTAAQGGEAAQLRLDSDRNLVQIVTVHKSKGLEYPVVFCPFVWDSAAPEPAGDGVEYHDDDHRPVIDFRPDIAKDEDIKLRRSIERAAEDARLIYVALTRAVHRCHVVAGCQGDKGTMTVSLRSVLNWLVAGDGMTAAQWIENRKPPGPEDVAQAWSRLADRSEGRIAVEALPQDAGRPIDTPRPDPEDIRALEPPRAIPPGWRLGSFSGMMLGAVERPAAADHDASVPAVDTPLSQAVEATEPSGPVRADDILAFPRGTDAGTCLHAMLERSDFSDAATWPAAVRTALAMHPQPLAGPDARARLERMALAMIGDVAGTPLPTGFALRDVSPARRLDEMEFHLPSAGLAAAPLGRLLERHGYAAPALGFGRLDGYLNGFIDLVFEHDGRWWLLDWKSNHLGTTAASYGPAALRGAMAAHGYHLQSLLYAVALDRWLALRQPGYERARHFGGVLYLFVRGVRPAWMADGQPAGVHFHRPGDEVIDALSSLMRPARKGRA